MTDNGGPVRFGSARETFGDRPAMAEEGFLGPGEPPALPAHNAPGPLELVGSQGEGDEGFFLKFTGGDPGGQDADAEAAFDEFLDGLGVAEFDNAVEHDLLLAEEILDGPEGGAVALVEDIGLFWRFGPGPAAGSCP